MLIELRKRITALEQQVSNMQRIGTIAELDTKRARVRVKIDKLLTAWLPWLTHRAGPNRTWHAPEVGEQVVVIAQGGNLALGIVLPAIFQTAHPAPADSADITCIEFKDGARIEYDRAKHHLSADIPGSASLKTKTDVTATIGGKLTANVTGAVSIDTQSTADITAAGPATLKAPTVKIDSPITTVTGMLTVQGLLTYQAGMAGSGSAGGGGAAVISGDIVSNSEITASGVKLSQHTHGGVRSGGESSGPPS